MGCLALLIWIGLLIGTIFTGGPSCSMGSAPCRGHEFAVLIAPIP